MAEMSRPRPCPKAVNQVRGVPLYGSSQSTGRKAVLGQKR